jgi:hypothetical protein
MDPVSAMEPFGPWAVWCRFALKEAAGRMQTCGYIWMTEERGTSGAPNVERVARRAPASQTTRPMGPTAMGRRWRAA